jgi:hypothetical protein
MSSFAHGVLVLLVLFVYDSKHNDFTGKEPLFVKRLYLSRFQPTRPFLGEEKAQKIQASCKVL